MAGITENEARLADMLPEEFTKVLKRISVYAHKRVSSLSWRGTYGSGELPNGDTSQSIVQTAIEKLLSGAKWDSDKSAETVLRGIVDSLISNSVRSLENRNFESPKPLEGEGQVDDFFDKEPSDCLNSLELLQRTEDDEEALELLYEFEHGTIEHRIISAIFGGANKRAEIFEIANVTAREYEAAKKRLRTYLEKRWQKRASAQHKVLEAKS